MANIDLFLLQILCTHHSAIAIKYFLVIFNVVHRKNPFWNAIAKLILLNFLIIIIINISSMSIQKWWESVVGADSLITSRNSNGLDLRNKYAHGRLPGVAENHGGNHSKNQRKRQLPTNHRNGGLHGVYFVNPAASPALCADAWCRNENYVAKCA